MNRPFSTVVGLFGDRKPFVAGRLAAYRLLKDLEDTASRDTHTEAGAEVGAGPLSSSSNMARSGSTSHREHAKSGPSVSTASANGAEYRPHLGRVGADRPDPRSFAEQLTNTGGGIR